MYAFVLRPRLTVRITEIVKAIFFQIASAVNKEFSFSRYAYFTPMICHFRVNKFIFQKSFDPKNVPPGI